MPTVITEHPPTAAPLDPPRKRWTREECELMVKSGLDLERLELIDGDLISKVSKNRPHSNTDWKLLAWLIQAFGMDYVQHEAVIDVARNDNATNEPVPDLCVLRRPFTEFNKSNPGPEDLLLVIEVSDSSLAFDLRKKSQLYARAEIIEYWVVDVNRQRLIVHRDPSVGAYQSITEYSGSEQVAPLAAPQSSLIVASLFA